MRKKSLQRGKSYWFKVSHYDKVVAIFWLSQRLHGRILQHVFIFVSSTTAEKADLPLLGKRRHSKLKEERS